ncbi:MAG TPA: ligand-binding protein SH3, partial [Candidatus Lambdaproteobacteria bacterium]|nr:ligand-binding protein SH3 [Candidatus Lambdaproteobacteria bacterium]
MRTCLLSGDWKKAYKMSEFQSFKVSKFQRVAPNSVSGLVFYLISFFFVLIFGLGIPDVILAQETSEDAALEDVLSGFDDEGAEEDDVLSGFDDGSTELLSGDVDADGERESGVDAESWSNLSGSTGLSLSYSYVKEKPVDKTGADWSGLTKLRPYFSLTWDAKLGENWKTRISGKAFYDFAYGMKERENFSNEVLAELEQEAEFREIYLEGSPFGSLDVKIGKQIVAWGVANSLRVVDVLNSADNREFGMTDLEDVRLPIAMTKLDYYIGDLKLEAVAVHEIKFNKAAPFGSDFNSSPLKIKEIVPESSTENTEYGLAVFGTFSGWDASLHWAQYFDDTPHFKITKVTIIPGLGAVPTLEQRHSRLTMGGATLSIPSGNFLWKAEAAKLQGMEFALVTDKTFSRTD